ncbi:MAG: hypothetical protein Q8830_03365 [Candidatus Phytoplasma australasiaticum]|nr:hypothetical protein [Candidatus Phytoplasma australasiaticum]
MDDENKEKWMEAMQDEMKSLHENKMFDLVKLPNGKRVLKNKWVFRIKHEEHRVHPRFIDSETYDSLDNEVYDSSSEINFILN